MKVVQELMRHANLRTTMDLYTQAPMGAKREAQKKIAEQIAQADLNVPQRSPKTGQ